MSSALLLAAGLATRLGALREAHAKACLPVAGTTPLAFLIRRLAAAGVREIWVNLHWQGAEVRAEAERAAPPGVALHFLEEPRLLGTGGTLLEVTAARGGRPPELVLNAKILVDLDLAAVLASPPGTLVLYPPASLEVFGGFRHAGGRARGLRPKGPPAREAGTAVYTGVCRPHPAWLETLRAARAARPGEALCLVRDGLLPALAAGRARPPVLLHHGHWWELSTPERLAAARAELTTMGFPIPGP